MTAFRWDARRGTLADRGTVSSLPADFTGPKSGSEIAVHPSGKFLYASNRGHDSLVIYRIDRRTGRLAYVGHQPTQGKTPRQFEIDPTGRFLLVANQDTDRIVTFRIDPQTGTLEPTGQVVQVPTPVCVKFLRPRGVS